ncbi:hypothetical protein FA95DRAFT_446364 [Auriscalpium vulgare]|uniref:Uncharacterized protein n=2 Tax=Auriscalpium vulgare TaxID=40419 RepID=A0ACB8RGI4_9AGAM|nr:hypothetical protein FA95DRAFT_1367152 [Auriscalpium vulgare]KAI0043030.1 hypothetical protein FA95DRAFT_446364 [Auriscalpium vulgare]
MDEKMIMNHSRGAALWTREDSSEAEDAETGGWFPLEKIEVEETTAEVPRMRLVVEKVYHSDSNQANAERRVSWVDANGRTDGRGWLRAKNFT